MFIGTLQESKRKEGFAGARPPQDGVWMYEPSKLLVSGLRPVSGSMLLWRYSRLALEHSRQKSARPSSAQRAHTS